MMRLTDLIPKRLKYTERETEEKRRVVVVVFHGGGMEKKGKKKAKIHIPLSFLQI